MIKVPCSFESVAVVDVTDSWSLLKWALKRQKYIFGVWILFVRQKLYDLKLRQFDEIWSGTCFYFNFILFFSIFRKESANPLWFHSVWFRLVELCWQVFHEEGFFFFFHVRSCLVLHVWHTHLQYLNIFHTGCRHITGLWWHTPWCNCGGGILGYDCRCFWFSNIIYIELFMFVVFMIWRILIFLFLHLLAGQKNILENEWNFVWF